MAAASKGGTACMQRLLDAGADHSRRNNAGRTALHHATRQYSPSLLQTLLKPCNAADVNAQDEDGNTPLMYPFAKGFYVDDGYRCIAVQMFLDHGADIHLKNKAGETATSLARSQGRKNIVGLLEGLGWIDETKRNRSGPRFT
eukprot:m.338755 g.338755  ORF g.338755 m.338755 type:complete len:143 (-) comp55737_c0_seq11:63-491(-)